MNNPSATKTRNRVLTSYSRGKKSCLFTAAVAIGVVLQATFPLEIVAAEQPSLPSIISLDGTWKILFDPKNEGREAGWRRDEMFSSIADQRNIEVPSCWELIEKDYEGVAFYRRKFIVPASWRGKVIRLHFDAVNFLSEVWLNDQAVGVHEGGFTPFEFRIDKLIRPGEENTLTLRVVGPILLQDKRVDGIGPMETPQWRGAITGGIWQSVKLVATGNAYVKDIFIEAKISDNTAAFHLQLVHAGERNIPAQVEIVIRSAGQPDQVAVSMQKTLDLKPGLSRKRWNLQIPDATYWSPDNPHLYRAEVNVSYGDEISDRWSSRFGMREFTIRDKRYYMNGKPLYLKATFFEGLYPGKLAQPDSREMAVREIRLAKDAGFNMIRPWRKPPPPMWLDLADEMGVLTVGSLAIECMDFPVESARLPGWVENEVRQSILRDRNRACVVQWELFNELKRPVLKQMLHPMSMLARQLDPTRLVLDESGGWARGARMYLPYQSAPTRFNDIHNYPGQQINDEVFQKLLLTGSKTHDEMRRMGLRGRLPGRNVVPGLMTFFSELGYGSLPDLVDNNRRFTEIGNPIAPPTIYHRRLADQQRQALKESGFDKIYPDLQRFCLDQQQIHGTANKRMIEAVRCNPNVRGYCVHALTAGDWIVGAGLLDLFRNPKTYAYEATKAANQPRILSIRVRPRNVYADRGTKIEITGVNDTNAVDGDLKLEIVASDGGIVFTRTTKANMQSGLTPLFSKQFDTETLKGTYTLRAKIIDDDDLTLAADEYNFDIFAVEQLVAPKRRIAVLDLSNSLKPFLTRTGITFAEFNAKTDRSFPVFVSRTRAHTPPHRKLFAELADFIKAGGTAVYLEGGGPTVSWGKSGPASPLLPINVRTKRAIGNWACIPRLVNDHPIFDGLPTGCMMDSIYENVWAQSTLLGAGGDTIAGSIGYDWFPDYDLSRRHYYGPGDTWWGADVAVVPLGKGRCIPSQLRLVDNLGKDPVADKIFYNLIEFVSAR
jgi:beta-galactosidase